MGNYIKTSFILDPNTQQPFTGKSLDFLMGSYKEDNRGVILGLIGYQLTAYQLSAGVVVSGCTMSGSGNTIYNGWIIFNNEIFFFPGAMGLLAFSNVPVFVLDETSDPAIDPVEFSDNTMKSVHQIRRLKIVDQVSGTGLFDLSQMERRVIATTVSPSNYSGTGAGAAYEDITGATFTSPARTCDLEVIFEYDIKLEQIASGAGGVNPNVELFGPGILKTAAHRMSGFGAAANQKVQTRGIITYIYRNCPASTVIKARMQSNTVTAAEVAFSGMSLIYRELTDR